MCGRFVRSSPLKEIADYFDVDQPSFEFEPSYNVAPTHDINIIINNRGVKQLVKCHWGFVPPWSKELSDGYKMCILSAKEGYFPPFSPIFRNNKKRLSRL
jgi:putative SOS response-associated peptidase YedK